MADELFLIDGNSLAYRAFFALPESIATSTGVPTNAIFGFASMLVKIVTDYGVQPTVVAWDAGTSGRNELFAEYKAQRRSRPDLLREQWPVMEPLVQAFGTLEEVLANVEAVKGAKRKQNLIAHAEDARVSKQLATVRRDLDVDVDVVLEAAREPDRGRVREVFREYELRDPLRRLEEALGDPDVAAPPSAAEVTLTATLRA